DACPEICPRLHRYEARQICLHRPGRSRSPPIPLPEPILSPETGVRIPVAVLPSPDASRASSSWAPRSCDIQKILTMAASDREARPYDVAVVGAGLAGLNALAVASKYLTKDDRVLMVDRRSRAGGMWVDTYPYVRLHQPHPFFTAADIKWTLDADRAHLATKDEVLDHFSHCVEVVKGRVDLDQWLGTEFLSHETGKGTIRPNCPSPDSA